MKSEDLEAMIFFKIVMLHHWLIFQEGFNTNVNCTKVSFGFFCEKDAISLGEKIICHPYLDYEFVMVFKIRQDSNIYKKFKLICNCVTYLTILGKGKQSPNVMLFFCIFPLKFANFFSKHLRIMCKNILTLFYFW
jgi:hypothetical protein